MQTITVYLRAPLFVPREGAAAPARAMVLRGQLISGGLSGGITLQVRGWADQDGKTLVGEPRTLFLPNAKIDHAALEG